MTLRAYLIPANVDASDLPWLFEGERTLTRHKGTVMVDGSIVGYPETTVVAISEVDETQRVAALWQAAHDYEYAQISGSAIGLLAMGVMQGLPKCLAVQTWIKSIWDIYYARKATTSTDYSFDVVGPIPHSVPELMTELGL